MSEVERAPRPAINVVRAFRHCAAPRRSAGALRAESERGGETGRDQPRGPRIATLRASAGKES